jgi:hypothetical protein
MSYTYDNLKDSIIDSGLVNNVTSSTSIKNAINKAVRETISEIDLRSTKRKASAIKIFDGVYDYTCPTDMKGRKIVDIQSEGNRLINTRLSLVDVSTFDRKKTIYNNMVAFADRDFVRKLRTTIITRDESAVISEFASLTEGSGTWTAFGDAENVEVNNTRAVSGSTSLEFDIDASGGTTAGVSISDAPIIDVSDYKSDGSLFYWVYIVDTTDITNYILRIGSDSSNYYSMTVTTTSEGLAFQNGWNLLRFDFNGKTTVGTPDDENCDYRAIYMTKDAGKVSETGYRFDEMTIHSGNYHNVIYYSKYAWKTNVGVYIENSTADTDIIIADTEEIGLFTSRGQYEVYKALKDYEQMKIAYQEYEFKKLNYKLNYPSEAVKMEQYYYGI